MTNFMKTMLLILTACMLISCNKQTSEEHIIEARQYLIENNSGAAIVEFKNAIQTDPKSAVARFELGQLYFSVNEFESAEKELNRAMEYGYDESKVLPLLTQAYQRTGAYSALSKLEHQQTGMTPLQQAEIGYFKVMSLARLGKKGEARILIEELKLLDTRSVFKGLTLTYAAILNEEYDLAIEELAALRKQNPQNEEVLKLLGQLHLTQQQPEAAAEVFEDYVKYYPNDHQMMFVLAKLLVDSGQTAEAEPLVDKLLKINERNGLLNQLKSAVRAAANDFPNAQLYAEKAIQNGIVDPSLRLIAGYAAYQQKDFDSANRHLSFVASSLPDNHPGLKLLAASQLQLGLSSEAGDVLNRLDQLTEQDAPLFSKASYELLRSGYVKDAKELIEKSSTISATAEDLTRLGLLQLSLNNLEGIVNLEQALEQSPKLSSAKTTLATAYIATRQYDKALELADSWKLTNAQDIKALMLAGEAYFKQKMYVAAKQEFEQVLAIDTQHAMANLALINLDVVQGNNANASTQLEALLKKQPTFIPALATYYLVAKKQGDTELGVQRVQQVQQSQPNDIDLRILLAGIYSAEQQYSESLALLEDLEGKEDLPLSFWRIRGQSLIRSNKRIAAGDHYDAWLLESPYNKDATIGKLLLLDNQSMFADGLALTEGFLEKRDDLQVQLLQTHFLLMSADYPAAKKAYDELPDTTYELPIVKGFLARLQLHDKNPQDALGNAQFAYQAMPNSRNLILVLYTYEQLERKDEGEALLVKHLEAQPNDLAARMLLAERQIAKDKTAAMSSYEKALEQNPNNYIARNNLAFLYLELGNIKKAREHASVAVELKPQNAAALDTLAQVLVAEQNYDEALKHYARAITDDMRNEEIYLNYVDALFAANRLALAKRKLEQRELLAPASITRVAEIKAKYNVE
ncbi:MAG: putative PEP-CTERM system TPR-repeat lipoprotein [Paraglaciecola sp.]|jgi:putative PEP-CTERM system TPR-repeat lipoprotein